MAVDWHMDPTVLGIALLTIADSSSFVSANNPSFFTVRHFSSAEGNKPETTREDIHIGLVKAGVETVLVGVGGALITGSWWPLVLPAAYWAFQVGFFRWALDNPHHGARSIAEQRGVG